MNLLKYAVFPANIPKQKFRNVLTYFTNLFRNDNSQNYANQCSYSVKAYRPTCNSIYTPLLGKLLTMQLLTLSLT